MKQVENRRMAGVNPAISIIKLEGNELKTPFKRQRLSNWIKKSQTKPSAVNKTIDSKT